jgi:hypothetical protein
MDAAVTESLPVMQHLMRVVTLLSVVMLMGCGGDGLPVNFNSLTLDKKVAVYGNYLEDHVNPQDSARLSIASHGGEAAGQMAEYLAGERAGFPSLEAIILMEALVKPHCKA